VSFITILFGFALMALGAIGYLRTDALTSLIPGYFGIPLCLFGFIGLWSDRFRMHVMHGAVLVSLIGFLVAVGRLAITVPAAISGGGFVHPTAAWAVLLMALLCGAHVGLCVKSFIDARRRRKQAASTSAGQIPT
jgi:hypothetical protein